nr:helix-turn-helix transcriptional regulator [Bradyrhizobium lablabi]
MSRITGREQEVLTLIGRMMNCRRIAEALQISEFTARKHRASIMRKLGLRTTAQLTAHAMASAGVEKPSAPFPRWLAAAAARDRDRRTGRRRTDQQGNRAKAAHQPADGTQASRERDAQA